MDALANQFADVFRNKTQKIRLNLQSARDDNVATLSEEIPTATAMMSEFEMVSEADVEKIIRNSATKSCDLDPLPTWLLKECLTSLLPVVTKIINLSLSEGEMQHDFKEAILIPML